MCRLHSSTSLLSCVFLFFFFNDTATTEIYTLSLHDALPISMLVPTSVRLPRVRRTLNFTVPPRTLSGVTSSWRSPGTGQRWVRSEEHTSELQSLAYLVCRLLLEKKKKTRARRTRVRSGLRTY